MTTYTPTKAYEPGFSMPEHSVFETKPGLSREVVKAISAHKKEPQWMLDFRMKAFSIFESKPVPTWGGELSKIDFNSYRYYVSPGEHKTNSWDEVPQEVKDTYDRLGIPEAEKKYLAGVGAQYDSEVLYHSLKKELRDQGVIFVDTDTAVRDYPELVRPYFGTIIPPQDNKFSALNSAVWSGGSFIYVPKNVEVTLPLQAYFRINAENIGQFERTLIVVDEGAVVHYVEGCSAPIYVKDSLHSAVVEIIIKKGGRCRYTTIQNWSKNVYNLVTKRASVYENGTMEWVDFNSGSCLTMKYPSCYLRGRGAKGEILSVALAGPGQHQDAGGKILCLAPETSGTITSKSVSFGGGRTSYRGLVRVRENATNAKVHVVCDALLLDPESRSDTYPTMQIEEESAEVGHEATVATIGNDQLLYLQSRGLSEAQARSLIVNGFFAELQKELPMEYAIEMNRLIQLEMEGSVG